MKEPLTGGQLYTLRNYIQTADAFDRTLERLARMGVQDVQISGIGESISAQEQKEILQRHKMRVCVTHQSYDRILNNLPQLIELHQTIGCDALGLGYSPAEARRTLADVRAFLKRMEGVAKELQKNGIGFHYHNNDFEFAPLQDSNKSMMDVLLEESDPALIHLIPDVAWIHFAGCDPVTFLKENADRVKVVHFKDYVKKADARPKFASLGQGVVPLRECFAVCREQEIPYVMYEQDDNWTMGDPFLATEESLRCFTELHQS